MRVRHQSWPQQRTCKRARFQNAATAPSAETLDSSLDGLKKELLAAVEGLERGTKNEQMPDKTAKVLRILRDIDARKCCPKISSESLSADWRLLWTTEKETLFILQRAGVFGTKAGNVWQVSANGV